MAKQFYPLETIIEYLSNNKNVGSIKITKFEKYDFNSMEGFQITFNVNVTTTAKYKNKRVSIHTNSSYLEWQEIDDTSDAIETFLENLYI